MVYGLDTASLPENWTPLESVAILKCLDESGEVVLCIRATDGLSMWEALGMLTGAVALTTDDLKQSFEDDDDEDE